MPNMASQDSGIGIAYFLGDPLSLLSGSLWDGCHVPQWAQPTISLFSPSKHLLGIRSPCLGILCLSSQIENSFSWEKKKGIL